MKIQPSSAIENGFTAQFTNSVTPMPRQWRRTSWSAPKSIFMSIGMIMTQMSSPTGMLTWATSMRPISLEESRRDLAERDARDDAQADPERQPALEKAEAAADCVLGRNLALRAHAADASGRVLPMS